MEIEISHFLQQQYVLLWPVFLSVTMHVEEAVCGVGNCFL